MGAEPTRHSSLDILRQAARLDFAGTTLVAVQRALSLYFNGVGIRSRGTTNLSLLTLPYHEKLTPSYLLVGSGG